MLIQKIAKLRLARIYFTPRAGLPSLDWSDIAAILEEQEFPPARSWSLNDQPNRPISKVLLPPFRDLEYLMVNGDQGELLSTISQVRLKKTSSTYELMLLCPNKVRGRAIDLAPVVSRLRRSSDVHYGYARDLRSDHSPTSEKKLKKGLFGGVSVSVGKWEDDWLMNPHDLREGAIKGFYPGNFWTQEAVARIRKAGIHLPFPDARGEDIYVFDEGSRQEFIARNAGYSQYMRFGAT